MKSIHYPLIIVNFKTYTRGTGQKGLQLAKICDEVAREFNVSIAVAVQMADIRWIASEIEIPVFAQHVDAIYPGSNTGHILLETVKEAGATGTLVNHSERKITLKEIALIVQRARENHLYTCVCASTPKIAGAIAALSPDSCATEPPELIGSGISVSMAQPEVITKSVEIIEKFNPAVAPLCGAGITNSQDVEKALELGTKGILIASGVVKATDPKKILEKMAQVLLKFQEKK
ncbi:MAG: triose-phosphate isomerase [Candidatus Heimdallarchaeota archaeon]|nr:triose-phosphate isomerase [Candidatus Heimdallarchaeota archaeon]